MRNFEQGQPSPGDEGSNCQCRRYWLKSKLTMVQAAKHGWPWKLESYIAWEIVSEMFTEIQESKDLMDDVLTINEKKRKITLEQRRSFFVRMVSDPAIQPGFTKTPNRSQVATLFKDNNSPQNTTYVN
ncbi:hypothetical protein TKK_0011598 [Trichogramma kaykai]